jgi:hypothetical protein
MQLTKLRAAPVWRAEVPPCAPAAGTDGGTASQLIRSVGWTNSRDREADDNSAKRQVQLGRAPAEDARAAHGLFRQLSLQNQQLMRKHGNSPGIGSSKLEAEHRLALQRGGSCVTSQPRSAR